MRAFLPPAATWVAVVVLVVSTGCEATSLEVPITVVYPEDATPLAAADNVSVTLSPDGFAETFSVTGSEFSLEVELEPDGTQRELAIFLARGETLLGYGRTPPFSYQAAADAGVGVLVGYPGTLAALPGRFDLPDASLVVAPALGFGVIALGGDGSTLFFDAYTLDFKAAAALELPEGAVPPPEDGAFVPDSGAGVTRVGVANGVRAFRFLVTTNEWAALELGTLAQDDRTGAALLADASDDSVLIFGGGARTDVLRLSISEAAGGSDAALAAPVIGGALDSPRQGSSAQWLDVGTERIPILVGNARVEPPIPVAYAPTLASGGGAVAPWAGLACVVERTAPDPIPSLLCAGGEKDGVPTSDGLRIWVASDQLEVLPLPGLLAASPGDVRWFSDDLAVYAQGGERFFRIDRATTAVTEPPALAVRSAGGSVAVLPSGATVLVGGTDAQGAPVDVWQVFSPEIAR